MDKSPIERPPAVKDEHLTYLDKLRESGVTNMFGAGAYLEKKFQMTKTEARTVLTYWMDSFGERHPKG